uniref:Uncharacterized protein n=1 Tax=Anopheles minimus TaxID=112268 RepID=A0A182WCN5_9DIPT
MFAVTCPPAHSSQHTQQTSFNGSRHQHGRNSINHPGSLQPQISPISVEERMALTKSLDGETLQLTNRKNSSTLIGNSGNGLGHGKTTSNGNGAGNGSQSLLHHHHHRAHQQQQQHGEQMLPDGGGGTTDDGATTTKEQSVTGPTTMLMIVNKSSNCKIGGT